MKKILALTLSAALLLALLCACTNSGSQNSSDPAGEDTSGLSEGTPSEEPSNGPSQVDLAAFYLGITEKYSVCATPEQAYPDELANDDDAWGENEEDRPSMEERLQILEEQRDDLRQLGFATYPGLSDIAAEQCLVYVSMMSFNGAESVLVQVSDAADVDAVKDILQARVEAQKSGGAWYPDATKAWEENSRIVSNGNYVMLIVSEDCDAVVSEFNALFE